MIFCLADGSHGGEGDVSFCVEGDYFEVCNCDVGCDCVWLGAVTQPVRQARSKDVSYHGHWGDG